MNEAIEKFRKKTIRNTKIEVYLLRFYFNLLKFLDHVDWIDGKKDNTCSYKTNLNEKIVHVSAGTLFDGYISWENAKKFLELIYVPIENINVDFIKDKKLNEHKLLELINLCLGFINEIEITLTYNVINTGDKYKGFECLNKIGPENSRIFINEFLNNISKDFLLIYDKTKQMLLPTEQKELLEKINNPTFSEMVYLYKGSKTFLEKENNFSAIAKKMHFLFNKNDKQYRDLFLKYFNKEKLDNLSRECNGYFRHSITDPGDKEKSLEWDSFDLDKKNQIINECFSVYLFILSLLRDNNLINEFISSLNNN